MLIIANFDYAGTKKYKTHILLDDETRTACGLYMMERRGDWQVANVDEPDCKKCARYFARQQQPEKLPDEGVKKNARIAIGNFTGSESTEADARQNTANGSNAS